MQKQNVDNLIRRFNVAKNKSRERTKQIMKIRKNRYTMLHRFYMCEHRKKIRMNIFFVSQCSLQIGDLLSLLELQMTAYIGSRISEFRRIDET